MKPFLGTNELTAMIERSPSEAIREAERNYQEQIEIVADSIYRHREHRPIILISGPSGSGKTTTARRIEAYLDAHGVETHTLSLDNYFKTLTPEQLEQLREGRYNLEAPDQLDGELLREQLRLIGQGKSVELPRFDFAAHRRMEETCPLTRKPGELVILEGTHALNPDVTGDDEEMTARIYISVRTRIRDAVGKEMHPMKVRLLRRMLRDQYFRDRDIEHTIEMLDNVQKGEDLYIMPYKYRSTYDINTFLPYEVSVYKPKLFEALQALLPTYPVLTDVVKVMSELPAIEDTDIPTDSLVREFIGGSSIEY